MVLIKSEGEKMTAASLGTQSCLGPGEVQRLLIQTLPKVPFRGGGEGTAGSCAVVYLAWESVSPQASSGLSHTSYCSHYWIHLNRKCPNFTFKPTFYFSVLAFRPINKPALMVLKLSSERLFDSSRVFSIWHKSQDQNSEPNSPGLIPAVRFWRILQRKCSPQ